VIEKTKQLKEKYTRTVKWCWKAEKWLNTYQDHDLALDRLAGFIKVLDTLFPLQEKIETEIGRYMTIEECKNGFSDEKS